MRARAPDDLPKAPPWTHNARVKPVLFVFAHGAGAPSSHPWMVAWAAQLSALGAVETFDYPYMQGKRRAADPQAVLVPRPLARIQAAERVPPRHELILIGKS